MSNRLIPTPGFTIFPDLHYVDANDISQEERGEAKEFFAKDREYKKLDEYRSYLGLEGKKVSRIFEIWVSKGGCKLGIIKFIEILNHPDGYGIGDFRIIKLVYPEFRRTKESRYAVCDLFHILFFAGIAKKCYVYQRAKPGVEFNSSSFYLDVTDNTVPCVGKRYSTDNPSYVRINKQIKTDLGYSIVLYEVDGSVYTKMDLKSYFMLVVGRDESTVDRWLKEMDEGATRVKGLL